MLKITKARKLNFFLTKMKYSTLRIPSAKMFRTLAKCCFTNKKKYVFLHSKTTDYNINGLGRNRTMPLRASGVHTQDETLLTTQWQTMAKTQ